MESTKLNKDQPQAVYFSKKLIFHCEGIPFKIFKPEKKGSSFPDYGLLNLKTNERISGLFNSGFNTYNGDIRNKKGKAKFQIKFKNEREIELRGFREALEFGEYISSETETDHLESQIRASQECSRGGFENNIENRKES